MYMCDELVPEVGVAEQRLQGSTSTACPPRSPKPRGWFIHALTEITISEPVTPGDHDRDAGQEVRARRQPVPAVDVDRDEDRLDEEREALEREAEPEDVAEAWP